MKSFQSRLIAVLLMSACGPVSAQAPETDPANARGQISVRVAHGATSTTGTLLRRDIKWTSKIPLDKTYGQLTPEEKAELHALYESMPPGNEPPFPLTGMRPLFNAIRRGQQIVQAGGRLDLVVTVDAQGKATQVADYGGVEGKNAYQMTQYAGSVLLITKFKPAVCDGKPCESQFPLVVDLRMR